MCMVTRRRELSGDWNSWIKRSQYNTVRTRFLFYLTVAFLLLLLLLLLLQNEIITSNTRDARGKESHQHVSGHDLFLCLFIFTGIFPRTLNTVRCYYEANVMLTSGIQIANRIYVICPMIVGNCQRALRLTRVTSRSFFPLSGKIDGNRRDGDRQEDLLENCGPIGKLELVSSRTNSSAASVEANDRRGSTSGRSSSFLNMAKPIPRQIGKSYESGSCSSLSRRLGNCNRDREWNTERTGEEIASGPRYGRM